MSKYLITLKPLGKYFFGGDMTFQVGSDEKSDMNKAHEGFISYVIESNKFPQQTSLLGMLRYLILTKSPGVFSKELNAITAPADAEKLIGKRGFVVHPDHDRENMFGKIRSLSPCFLMRETESFLRMPNDYHYDVHFANTNLTAFCNSRPVVMPDIGNFDSKKDYNVYYIGTNTDSRFLENDIFKADERIGISKNYSGESDNKAFYKQISYRLTYGFSFGFVVDTDFDLSRCINEIVSLGADGSRFSLSAKTVGQDDDFWSYKPNMLKLKSDMRPHVSADGSEKIFSVVLSSDSLLLNTDLEDIAFGFSDTVPFRFLQFSVDDSSYDFSAGWKRSADKYYLYMRGSVFYFIDKTQALNFKDAVEAKKEFNQIGYNHAQMFEY